MEVGEQQVDVSRSPLLQVVAELPDPCAGIDTKTAPFSSATSMQDVFPP